MPFDNKDRVKEEEAKKKSRRVYTTELIDKLIQDQHEGYDIDYSPFFNRDLSLRAANVPFRMSAEEVDEYQKCYDDPEYYIDNYCKFMTDNGLSTVDLRDYQKKVIDIVTQENYDEDIDDIVPKNRNVCWLASRQVGKCCKSSSYISLLKEELEAKSTLGEIYSSAGDKNLFISVENFLCRISENSPRFIKNIFGILVQFIESIELRNKKSEFDENDDSKKIIDSRTISTKVKADEGYVNATQIHRTQPYTVYDVKLADGKHIECADNHILFTVNLKPVFVNDLNIGDFIFTSEHYSRVVSIYKCPYKLTMYDMTVDSKSHRYYTNDILSHNTTTISAFLSWMIVFHIDRNILIVANKEKTAIEIVDKITNIFKGLPYFLKPGCDSFGKTGLKLDNGSKIISSATTNTASIGFTIHCVLLDEFAHIPDNIVNNFWRSVYPTLSSSKVSQCIITSTPNGSTNKFYDIWSKSIAGKNSFVPVRTDYWEVPGHDEKWAQQMIADFGEDEFAQEFALQFNKNSRMLLKGSDLDFLSHIKRKYVHKQINVTNQYLDDENLTWDPNFDPNDISPTDVFVLLVDLAEGNGDPEERLKTKKKTPDSNTIQIFRVRPNSISNMRKYMNESCSIKDAFKFQQVGKYASNTQDEVYCAKVCSALCYNLFEDHMKNNVRVMVEMNFNGKSFFEQFKRHNLFTGSTILKTYHTKPVPGEQRKKKYGFKTTSNKEYFCLKGNKMIGQRRIVTTDEETYNQMQCFGYVKGKLEGIACHDDLSMPVFNHIPRMLDESSFVSWLEEYLVYYADKTVAYNINQMIQKWAMENPEMSDGDFSALYGLDETVPEYGDNMMGNILGGYVQQNPYNSSAGGFYGQQNGLGPGYTTYGSLGTMK